jgi:RNA polymerase sigma-70 factor (ECF subfamily)
VSERVAREAVESDVESLYREEAVRLWRALVGFTGSRTIADDAVAETFARLIRDRPEIQEPKSWIWRVAFRVATAEVRHQAKTLNVVPDVMQEEPSSDAADLVSALRKLTDKQRLAVVLHDYADRPTPEVAAILGCGIATLHVHLSRGRRRLRSLLEVQDA